MSTRILFLAANPLHSGRLALDREHREVDAALRSAGLRDQVELQSSWAVRVRDLQTALLRYEPTIVHLCGHGLPADGIVLADDGSTASGPALASLFRAIGRSIQLVVLNACWSAEQAEAIASVGSSVIGMRRTVADEAAIEFAQSFYEALAWGRVLQDAFDVAVARLALLQLGSEASGAELVVADGVDPDKLRLIG